MGPELDYGAAEYGLRETLEWRTTFLLELGLTKIVKLIIMLVFS